MNNEELREILISVGADVEKATEDFGVAPRSPEDRARLAINYLRDKICPYRDEILRRARARETELVLLLAELIAFWLGNQLPGLPALAKVLGEIGLERFCADPQGTLGKSAGVYD
jgi:hypothetical protein